MAPYKNEKDDIWLVSPKVGENASIDFYQKKMDTIEEKRQNSIKRRKEINKQLERVKNEQKRLNETMPITFDRLN